MIRRLIAACALIACHQTPMVDVGYHVADGGAPASDAGTDFLTTGTVTVGLAVAIDVTTTSSGAINVTSTDTAVLEVQPTTVRAFLIIPHTLGTSTLDFTVDGELARAIPVTVVPQ